jgi:predicted O-linked N-acetylglucosamine transferase (SPINDLY family)
LPAAAVGHVTFGSLNNFVKVNPAVLELWGRVLREVAGSRLLVLAPAGDVRRNALRELAKHGVDAARVEFVDRLQRPEYLATYQRIDVCLDTFPCNGHTTTMDALWMGVPVATLVGNTAMGRAGSCLATNVGMPELIARTPDDYVRIAADLCRDLARLGEIRRGLRARMQASPLMDGARFARNMELLFREIWRDWCAHARTSA